MKITGTTNIYGILGHPVQHTLSPILHNTAFRALGLDCCYLPFDVKPENLKKGIHGLRALGVKGFNLTVPHKETVIDLLDEVSPEAALIGAVNTVVVRRGRLVGYNTDGRGFVRSFREEMDVSLKNKRVLLLGAGGAARAIAFQLAKEKIKSLLIVNRTHSNAKVLARDLKKIFTKLDGSTYGLSPDVWGLVARDRQVDIIVNTTSVGMHPKDPLIVPRTFLKPRHIVCDLIYRPSKTRLLSAAEAAGAKTMNGLGMLLYQAALAFEIWVGKKPSTVLMRKAIKGHLYHN